MTFSAILASIIFVAVLFMTQAQAGYSQTPEQIRPPISVVDTIEEITTTTESTIENRGSVEAPYKESTTVTTQQIVPTTVIPTTTTVAVTTIAPVAVSNNSFLECVKNRESRGDYTAVNSSSGAGGAYQFLQTTWDNTARHIGRLDLVGLHPSNADPATQDMMAQSLLAWQGTSPWAYPASPC